MADAHAAADVAAPKGDRERRRSSRSRSRSGERSRRDDDRDRRRDRDDDRDRYDRRDDHRSSSRYDDRRDDRRSSSRYDDRDRARYGSSSSSSRYDDRRDDRYREDDRRRSSSRRRGDSRSPSRDRPRGAGVVEMLSKLIGGGLTQSLLPGAVAPVTVAAPAVGFGGAAAAPVIAAYQPPAPGAALPVVPMFAPAPPAAPAVDISATVARLQALAAMGANAPSAPNAGLAGAIGGGGGAVPQLHGVEKAQRELYIGGLPQGIPLTSAQLKDFFNTVMVNAGLARSPGEPVVLARIADTGTFAFVQFRSVEETDAGLALNGIDFLGTKLKVGRPKGYVPPAMAGGLGMMMGAGMGMGMGGNPLNAFATGASAAAGGLGGGGGVSSILGGSFGMPTFAAAAAAPAAAPAASAFDWSPTGVLLASNLGPFMTIEAVRDVLDAFGPIATAIMLPKEAPSTVNPAGLLPHQLLAAQTQAASTQRALVRFEAEGVVDTVIGGLQGLDIAGFAAQFARAPRGIVELYMPQALAAAAPAAPAAPAAASGDASGYRVVELTNVVVAAEVASANDGELAEIKEEVGEECSKYGAVVEVFIAPLTAAQRANGGAGQGQTSVSVFVVLETHGDALAVADKLRGRKFDGRPVSATLVPDAALAQFGGGASAGAAAAASGTGDAEEAEDRGLEGGTGNHFHGHAIPPPASVGSGSSGAAGAPEDGLALPGVPAAADLD